MIRNSRDVERVIYMLEAEQIGRFHVISGFDMGIIEESSIQILRLLSLDLVKCRYRESRRYMDRCIYRDGTVPSF